jgi:molybdopterin-guanine dinucleotide biosynthesis protein A
VLAKNLMAGADCAGVVLAGGRSRRMGPGDKALAELAGKPMLQHVIDRIGPQVNRLMLSVERESDDYAVFGLAQVADPLPGSRGPLGGLLAALRTLRAKEEWLLLVPCDAPFLPRGLLACLLRRAQEEKRSGGVISIAGEVQPTFSLWHRELLPRLERAVLEQKMAGFKQFLDHQALTLAEVEPEQAWRFLNINDLEALEQARQRLKKGRHERHAQC